MPIVPVCNKDHNKSIVRITKVMTYPLFLSCNQCHVMSIVPTSKQHYGFQREQWKGNEKLSKMALRNIEEDNTQFNNNMIFVFSLTK